MNTILIMTKKKFSFTKLITQYFIIILFEKFSTSIWLNPDEMFSIVATRK
jgi:hypothetical protein